MWGKYSRIFSHRTVSLKHWKIKTMIWTVVHYISTGTKPTDITTSTLWLHLTLYHCSSHSYKLSCSNNEQLHQIMVLSMVCTTYLTLLDPRPTSISVWVHFWLAPSSASRVRSPLYEMMTIKFVLSLLSGGSQTESVMLACLQPVCYYCRCALLSVFQSCYLFVDSISHWLSLS